ncbi:MAG TPA: ABC transporter ATP-binding protein [Thermodesulfobacteriota bacterium]|nr:ABC transporter ATP-binding protein [Thermodesulfobacteriota bacterium]
MSLEFNVKKRLDGFSLDVGLKLTDELMVLFGPSGAGKSLTLKMISGLVRPDEGFVDIGGGLGGGGAWGAGGAGGTRVFDSASGVNVPIRKRRTGYLFQDYALFPHMTVIENISYGINGLEAGRLREIVGELVRVMRLEGLEKRYPAELSGGQKQRTALARTLATGPRVLLLDEPFSALDYQVREKLRGDLKKIHGLFPITTILVTHDLEEAFMLGTRIAVINEGRIEQFSSREDVFYRPRTRNVARFVGTRNIFTGTVAGIDGPDVVIENPDIGRIRAPRPTGELKAGSEVSFCIRPEEIPVIRPERTLDAKVRVNLIEGEITETTGKGTTHTLFISTGKGGAGGAPIKVEVPNFVFKKLGLAKGKPIRVSLKKESVWVIL